MLVDRLQLLPRCALPPFVPELQSRARLTPKFFRKFDCSIVNKPRAKHSSRNHYTLVIPDNSILSSVFAVYYCVDSIVH